MMLSVIIPARNEIYLERTIRNILENAQGELEIIVELDGYIPDPQIVLNDNRVTFIHHKESIGQRAAINHAASIAKGKYIMKLDAHCAVAPGFDVELAKTCEPDWTVVPRMHNLDTETWKPKLHKKTDYMYISGPDHEKPFRALYYEGEEYSKWHSRPDSIDDTMACMGPGWFMTRQRFLEQGGCDESHEGGWGQQGIEVSLKAWLSGGSLKVNKNTWFAHWFRGGNGGPGFPYPISGSQVEKVRKYSRDLWLNDKWPLAKRKLSWLVEKFNPSGWNGYGRPTGDDKKREIYLANYRHFIKPGNNFIRWRGVPMLKFPGDVTLYQQIIHERKPDFIVETGTKYGGSALFFGDMCEINGHGRVISVDIHSEHNPVHPRVTYLKGNSTDLSILDKIKEIAGNGSVMVVLDSLHTYRHVKWELFRYSKIVTKGQYMVVEDCYNKFAEDWGPKAARDWYLKRTKRFKLVDMSRKVLTGMSMEGWLLCL